ncbi:uncharacterized protein LOC143048369 [Mytilus galloprovincialis]|uniref:uncharacterized protein LOC143048369 n=1 Tax=Mytilus galloprovincialis TaxID=29158 RepID=UPI003F7B5F99
MANDKIDVTGKFLSVIRERRKEKFGKNLYGTDGTMDNNFDSEGYFRELITRNKIRIKLKAARERRNTLIDTDSEEEEEDKLDRYSAGPSLLSKILKQPMSETPNGGNTTISQSKNENRDSGKGTPSGDTIQSYNDGSIPQFSPAKTMKRVKLKLKTAKHLSSVAELKKRNKKEQEKQMELLETIRMLRGVDKEDFYRDSETESEQEVSDNAEFALKNKHDIKHRENIIHEIMKNNEQTLNRQRILSPIANQLLTPERCSSPECATSTVPTTPTSHRLNIFLLPDSPSRAEKSPEIHQVEIHTESPMPPEVVKNPDVSKLKDKPTGTRRKCKKCKKKKYVVTSGSKIDSRWPKGHKLFTQPTCDYSSQNCCKISECYTCYTDVNHDMVPVKSNSDIKRNKRRDVKLRKICFEHAAWRETLIRIAYEREFDYLKQRSLRAALYPYQKSSLEKLVANATPNLKNSSNTSMNPRLFSSLHVSSRRPKSMPVKIVSGQSQQLRKDEKTKLKCLKFQTVNNDGSDNTGTVRTKSGHTSNDQGYDSDENCTETQEQIHNDRIQTNNIPTDVTEKQRKQKLQVWK